MIILDATTRSLQIVLGGSVTTSQLPFTASYVDLTSSAYTPDANTGLTNNTSAVAVAAAPASSTVRQIKNISIYNADTANATVRLIYNDNSTLRTLFIATLSAGDNLIYEDAHGFSVLDSTGSIKQSAGGGGGGGISQLTGGVTAGPGTGAVSATVVTNANLTGPVTSTGNATAIANGAISNAMLANTAVANLSGTNTGDQTSVSGNAGTATALQTGRAINGVTFDGTAGITVTAAAVTLTGTTLASNVVSSSLTSVGTLASLTVTNPITGSVTGNAGTVTTNANLTGPITSSGNATSVASQTGTGNKFVMDTSPTLVTPILGVAAATSVNKMAITAPATGSTLAVADGKTLTASNTITLTGSDGVSANVSNGKTRNATFALDGGGSAISAGGTWYLANIPFAGTITGWDLVADQSGSIVIDVWKANASVPTIANTITASALPTLSSAQGAFNGAITGWTTSVAAGDVLAFHVNSASTVTKASLSLLITAS